MKITKVYRLPREDESGSEIVRFCNSRISAQLNIRPPKNKFHRRQPVVIINPANDCWVLRYAMGNPGTMSIKQDEIAVDYDALVELDVHPKHDVELTVRNASWLEVYIHFMRHPDLNVRISMRLGVIGFVLGIIGLFQGLTPLLLG